jgi:hypothetical protein
MGETLNFLWWYMAMGNRCASPFPLASFFFFFFLFSRLGVPQNFWKAEDAHSV